MSEYVVVDIPERSGSKLIQAIRELPDGKALDVGPYKESTRGYVSTLAKRHGLKITTRKSDGRLIAWEKRNGA